MSASKRIFQALRDPAVLMHGQAAFDVHKVRAIASHMHRLGGVLLAEAHVYRRGSDIVGGWLCRKQFANEDSVFGRAIWRVVTSEWPDRSAPSHELFNAVQAELASAGVVTGRSLKQARAPTSRVPEQNPAACKANPLMKGVVPQAAEITQQQLQLESAHRANLATVWHRGGGVLEGFLRPRGFEEGNTTQQDPFTAELLEIANKTPSSELESRLDAALPFDEEYLGKWTRVVHRALERACDAELKRRLQSVTMDRNAAAAGA